MNLRAAPQRRYTLHHFCIFCLRVAFGSVRFGYTAKSSERNLHPLHNLSLSLSPSLPFSVFLLSFLFPFTSHPLFTLRLFHRHHNCHLVLSLPPPLLLPSFSSPIRVFIFVVLIFIAPYSCLSCLRKAPQTARCPSQPHRGFCCV